MKAGFAIAAAFAVGFLCAQAQAQPAGDMQQAQQLCSNDVFRLCGNAVPDRGRIEACLRRNFRQVSAPCRNFMAHYAARQHGRVVSSRHHRHVTRHHRRTSRHHYRQQ